MSDESMTKEERKRLLEVEKKAEKALHALYGNGIIEQLKEGTTPGIMKVMGKLEEFGKHQQKVEDYIENAPEKCPIGSEVNGAIKEIADMKEDIHQKEIDRKERVIANLEKQKEDLQNSREKRRNYYFKLVSLVLAIFGAFGTIIWRLMVVSIDKALGG